MIGDEMSKSVGVTLELAMYVGEPGPLALHRLSNPVECSVLAADERAA